MVQVLNRTRLNHLLGDERLRFLEQHPRSIALSTQAEERFVAINRGVVLTPFLSNIALMCVETTEADIDRHTEVLAEAVDTLMA